MKKIQIFTMMLFFLALSLPTFAQGKSSKKKGKTKGNQEVIIMTSAECDMCKETIEKALVYSKGVKNANLNVESKKLTVVYNSNKISPDEIRQIISKTGYNADEISADKEAYKNLPKCCKVGGMKPAKEEKKGCCQSGKSKCESTK